MNGVDHEWGERKLDFQNSLNKMSFTVQGSNILTISHLPYEKRSVRLQPTDASGSEFGLRHRRYKLLIKLGYKLFSLTTFCRGRARTKRSCNRKLI